MNIDKTRKHVLTKIGHSKKGAIKKESDHNVLLTEFSYEIDTSENRKKVEMYNLKNVECQKQFREYTSGTKMLSSIFDSNDNLDILAHRFIKKLAGCIMSNFRKIRIGSNKKSTEELLLNRMRELKGKEDEASKKELNIVVQDIANIRENKYVTVVEELSKLKPDEGKINAHKFWRLKKKLFPKSWDPPAAFVDKHGNLLTTKNAIEKRALEAYSERLKPNKVKDHLKSYEETVNKLCEKRLDKAKAKKTDPWSMDDLEEALKSLDKDKARDALGLSNEIFKEGVAGTDLKLAVLKFMNRIKADQKYPEALEPCNITLLYKQKGSRKEFDNYCGVFRVTIFRSILDRLIYNDSYHTVDSNLTDHNVGARKCRNIRDNIFVLGAVVNSVVNGKEGPIQIQIGDVEKCFDKLWLENTTNALFEAGLNSDLLNLLYLENQNARIAIKVNNHLTERINVRNAGISVGELEVHKQYGHTQPDYVTTRPPNILL